MPCMAGQLLQLLRKTRTLAKGWGILEGRFAHNERVELERGSPNTHPKWPFTMPWSRCRYNATR